MFRPSGTEYRAEVPLLDLWLIHPLRKVNRLINKVYSYSVIPGFAFPRSSKSSKFLRMCRNGGCRQWKKKEEKGRRRKKKTKTNIAGDYLTEVAKWSKLE